VKPAVLLVFLSLSAAATAQSAGNSAAEKLNLSHVTPAMRCPIGMHARHDFFFRKDLVSGNPPQQRGGDTAGEEAMEIRLTLTNPDAQPITNARIVVRGTNGNWRTIPLGSGAGKGDLKKSMEVTFERGDGQDVDSFLILQGFTAVQSIALDTVTYADGSTWKAAGACRVAPDPFMLVADR
jgi:hypothetical protein